MEWNMPAVKGSRRYDSTRRARQAAETRDAVIAAARRRFLSAGYAGTTIAAVARDADVSVETVYKTFGGKAGLVRAIWERALAGRGPVPAPVRSDAMSAAEPDAVTMLREWGRLTAEVGAEVAPVLLLIRAAAATDPAMTELLTEADDQRLKRMRHNAQRLLATGGVRPGLSLAQATDILWTFSSTEMYELLVVRRGWSAPRYGRLIGESLVAALT